MASTARLVRYGVAASLDGYIAGPNGEADWIPMDPDIDFREIYSRFDTLLIGRKTFAAMTKGGGGGGGMPGMQTFVFSTTLPEKKRKGVTIVRSEAAETVAALKASPGKDIWLFGGGELFRFLAGHGLVDRIDVAVCPVMLGGGRPLFPGPAPRIPLKLLSQRLYDKSGIVSLEYEVLGRQ